MIFNRNIVNTICIMDLFGKRDAFPFHINRISKLDGNIMLFKIFCGLIGSEIVCMTRTTTYLMNMVKRVVLLLIRMKMLKWMHQWHFIIEKKYWKFFHKFTDIADKFIKLFSLQLFLYMCLCVFMYKCIYMCICRYVYVYLYVCFIFVIWLYVYILKFICLPVFR